MRMLFAAVHMAAIGTKRTSRPSRLMSAFGGKADIGEVQQMSAFDPKRTSANASKISIRADTMVSASVSGEIRFTPESGRAGEVIPDHATGC